MPKSIPKTGLPDELVKQLSGDEEVHFFSPVEFQGGCLSFGQKKANYWAALTNKRFLYHANVREGDQYSEREGIIQLNKITSMEVIEMKTDKGCFLFKSSYYELRVNAQGQIIGIPFPNREKGQEIRTIYYELENK